MAEQTAGKVPQIRFKGCDGAWVQKKLGEVTDVYDGTHQTPNYTKQGVMFLSVENIRSLKSNKFISEKAFKEEFKVFPQRGDVLMTRIGDIGTANIVESDEQVAYYVSLALFKLKGLDPYFLKQCISSNSVIEELWHRTLHIAFPKKINKNEIERVVISVPQLKSEQTQIGEYFRELDSLIGLHQRKHDKLVTLKKAMLQKMFPQPGTTTPEIRFKGFDGDWVEKKIYELGEVVTGSTPPTQNPFFYSENGIPWVTPTDIEHCITFNASKHLSAAGERVARVVPMNTILITCIASIGKNTLLGTRGSFNQQINGVVPFKENNDPYFLFTASVLWSQKMKSTAASGTMQIVNKSEFSEVKTQIPLIAEQQKIGTYFRTLDALISQHATRLQKLQQLKSACLARMFV